MKERYLFYMVVCILTVHFLLFNPFEKLLFYLYRKKVPVSIFRPTYKPSIPPTFSNLGMPSGHTEITTLVLLLLRRWKIVPFSYPVAFLLIFLVAVQRIYVHMHTPVQVGIGFLTGCLYFGIYSSLYSIHPLMVGAAILFYFFMLNILILFKITQENSSETEDVFNNDTVIEKIRKLYSILTHRDTNLTNFL